MKPNIFAAVADQKKIKCRNNVSKTKKKAMKRDEKLDNGKQ